MKFHRQLVLLLVLWASPVVSEEVFHLPAIGDEATLLQLYAAADFPVFEPVLAEFQKRHPDVAIRYSEFNTRVLYESYLERLPRSPDLILSSAMDLQIKLVNDGHARTHRSDETQALPMWAKWRNEIFGFTYEPVVIAINNKFLSEDQQPATRSELLDLIRQESDRLMGRIGTFDIENVGVGYLTWAHDRQQSGSYGRLLEAFGTNRARRFPSSSSMLRNVNGGEILIAYNVLGSYAKSWAELYPNVSVVMPDDYTALIMRSAFIPKRAPNPEIAHLFLDFLLSVDGQQLLADEADLFPIREEVVGELPAHSLNQQPDTRFQPIPLSLSLLMYTDQAKRRLIFEEWEAAMRTFD
ncbi:extracellular solute-binding protein [Marinobacter sp.]|uniref:extracellular solute-binding protein n=1 Tax=Marinobacter sp. TaxID=50741 RepID=UPI003A8D9330